jgi:hypothetical protein
MNLPAVSDRVLTPGKTGERRNLGDGVAEKAWVRETERRLDAHALPGGWAVLMAPGDRRARDAFGPNTDRLLTATRIFAATYSHHGK